MLLMLYTLFPLVANLYQTTKDVIKVGTRAETSNILTQKKKKRKKTRLNIFIKASEPFVCVEWLHVCWGVHLGFLLLPA